MTDSRDLSGDFPAGTGIFARKAEEQGDGEDNDETKRYGASKWRPGKGRIRRDDDGR
jgi:hypothetical protein